LVKRENTAFLLGQVTAVYLKRLPNIVFTPTWAAELDFRGNLPRLQADRQNYKYPRSNAKTCANSVQTRVNAVGRLSFRFKLFEKCYDNFRFFEDGIAIYGQMMFRYYAAW